jgi:hypothetical protein
MPNFAGAWTVTTQGQARGQSTWPAIPGTPTIGTASSASGTSVTVAFTANATNPGFPAPTYTATSSPGGFTGTSTTSPITVSGLTTGTSYTFTVTATNNSGTSAASAASNSAIPASPGAITLKAIFGYGYNGSVVVSVTNLVSNTGVVSTDTTGVGTARVYVAAAAYGSTGQALFGYGRNAANTVFYSMTNRVSNTGVVSADTTGVGTARGTVSATGYGGDKAIFGYGTPTASTDTAITNLVSNTGVVATDTAGVGTTKYGNMATPYGTSGQAIFGLGYNAASTLYQSNINLVSNTGVVSADTSTVGVTSRAFGLGAAPYGSTGQAMFAYAYNGTTWVNTVNLISNTGVVASNSTGTGTGRANHACARYGSDKAIYGYGNNSGTLLSLTNLVSNTGVVAADTTGVGTARYGVAAAGYSLT